MSMSYEELRANFEEEKGIVNRIWDLFGSPSYAELRGRSIYDLITEIQAENTSLKSRIADLEWDGERLKAACRLGLLFQANRALTSEESKDWDSDLAVLLGDVSTRLDEHGNRRPMNFPNNAASSENLRRALRVALML